MKTWLLMLCLGCFSCAQAVSLTWATAFHATGVDVNNIQSVNTWMLAYSGEPTVGPGATGLIYYAPQKMTDKNIEGSNCVGIYQSDKQDASLWKYEDGICSLFAKCDSASGIDGAQYQSYRFIFIVQILDSAGNIFIGNTGSLTAEQFLMNEQDLIVFDDVSEGASLELKRYASYLTDEAKYYPVPEPTVVALLAMGIVALALKRR